MISTQNYGLLPVAKDTTYIRGEAIDSIETADGRFYEVRYAYCGGVVAVEV